MMGCFYMAMDNIVYSDANKLDFTDYHLIMRLLSVRRLLVGSLLLGTIIRNTHNSVNQVVRGENESTMHGGASLHGEPTKANFHQ